MSKVLELKQLYGFRKATYAEREAGVTCKNCENKRMITFTGFGQQPRCGFFGDGVKKGYMITDKDTCDRNFKKQELEVRGENLEEQEQEEKRA